MNKKKQPDPADGARPTWNGPPIAILWDQSLVWGLICVETLSGLGIPFRLLSARDIISSRLEGCRVLVVPGGWASHKLRALGGEGGRRIRELIESGGSYLGFCGGAGLALSSSPALNLVPIERLSLAERLPNASGEIWIKGAADHPAWKGLPASIPVSIWWPSQFRWQPLPGSVRLADYHTTGSEFWVADVLVADLEEQSISWDEWEKIYGINLNPGRLLGHPAIIEVPSGKGRLVLSYPHLETPDDRWGNRLLLNLLNYLDQEAAASLSGNRGLHDRLEPASNGKPEGFAAGSASTPSHNSLPSTTLGKTASGGISTSSGELTEAPAACTDDLHPGNQEVRLDCAPSHKSVEILMAALDTAEDLFRFGERHLLWRWRNSWLLHWRRGIRGLEYGTLVVALRSLVEQAQVLASGQQRVTRDPWRDTATKLEGDVRAFCRNAQRLLLEEKLATQAGNLKKTGKVNNKVDRLRQELFGNKMNHGGLCGALFDELDLLLFNVLRQRIRSPGSHPGS